MPQCSERPVFSVTCYLDFFFSASGVWLVGSECKVPGECSSGDGGTASTSLMPGVGGIQLGRYTMESKTEDGDASGGRLSGLSLILRVMHSSNLCNYKQLRKKLNLLPFSKWTCPTPQGKHSHLWVLVAGWVLMRQVKCVCVVGVHACLCICPLLTSIIDRLCFLTAVFHHLRGCSTK